MHAVILAGGKGIRLRPYTTRLPKPLVPIGEEHSIMEILLSQLAWSGFSRVTLAIGHLGELIRSYVGDGSRWGVQVDYGMPEEMPLGTMGPVLRLLDRLPEDFLVMNGDVLTDLDYADLMRRHAEAGSALTVATAQRQVADRLRGADHAGRPRGGVRRRSRRSTTGSAWASTPAASRRSPATPRACPSGSTSWCWTCWHGARSRVEYAFDGYWFDIGRPDDYDRVNAEFGPDQGKPAEGGLGACAC